MPRDQSGGSAIAPCGKSVRRDAGRYGWVTGGGALSPWRKLARSVSLTSGSPGATLSSLPATHPLLELVHQREQVLERIDDEEQRLVVVDLEVLVDDPLDLEREALHRRATSIACAISPYERQQAAAVDLAARRPARADSRISPNSTVNQKKRDIALMLLVSTRSRSCSSAMRRRAARRRAPAHSPKRTSASANAGSVCIGTWPADVVEDVGLGQVVELAPSRMVMVVGNSRRRRQSKNTYDGT